MAVCAFSGDRAAGREGGDSSDQLDTLPEMDGSGGQMPSLQHLSAIWDGLVAILVSLIGQQVS